MPTGSDITVGQERVGPGEDNGRKSAGAKAKDGSHCVTAYAFWETREVRGACLVSPGGFCVAQLKPEPAWFSSASRSGSSSREGGRTEGIKGLQGNLVEVYFQSRRDQTGQCTPQDSLQRVGVGRGRDSGGSGTPMRRIGSVSLLRTPPGNPTFLRLRLGGAVVIQTSSKPLKTTDVAAFYVFLASTSTLENFTLRWEFFLFFVRLLFKKLFLGNTLIHFLAKLDKQLFQIRGLKTKYSKCVALQGLHGAVLVNRQAKTWTWLEWFAFKSYVVLQFIFKSSESPSQLQLSLVLIFVT